MNLFVGNLSPETNEQQLRDLFSEFGTIVSLKIIIDPQTGMPKGFGFVEFDDKFQSYEAMDNLDMTYFMGNIITVKEAKGAKGGGGGGNRGGGNRGGGFQKRQGGGGFQRGGSGGGNFNRNRDNSSYNRNDSYNRNSDSSYNRNSDSSYNRDRGNFSGNRRSYGNNDDNS